jgi:hypothetical protein
MSHRVTDPATAGQDKRRRAVPEAAGVLGSQDSNQEEPMSKSVLKSLVALAAAIFICSAIAFAAKAKTVSVHYDSILPNGQTLKAGEYTVHVDETAHKVQFMQKDKVIAETPCNCVEGKKNDKTECVFKKNKEGKQTLQEVRVKGDTKQIVMEGAGI